MKAVVSAKVSPRGNAAGEREKDHRAEYHDSTHRSGIETGVGGVNRRADAADLDGLSLAQVGGGKSAVLASYGRAAHKNMMTTVKVTLATAETGTGKNHHRVDQRAGAGERLSHTEFPIERGDAICGARLYPRRDPRGAPSQGSSP